MPRHESDLYDLHYFIKVGGQLEVDGVLKRTVTVKCQLESCTVSWCNIAPGRVSVGQLKGHLKLHHKEQWARYIESVRLTSSVSPTSPLTSSSSASSQSPSTSSSFTSVSMAVNTTIKRSSPIKRQMIADPVIENGDIPMTDSEKERKIIRATARFLAANNLSLRIVTSDTFRDLLELASGLRSSYVMSSPSIRAETLNTCTELKQLLYARLKQNTYVTVAFDGS